MDDASNNLDDLIADNVREFELNELRCFRLKGAEREQALTDTLGPKKQTPAGESFVIGDASAGITSKSLWFQSRRIYFSSIVSIAVGEVKSDGRRNYCIEINCTVKRSYRITVASIRDTDTFLEALSQLMTFKIVPTFEEQLEEQRRQEELVAANEANADIRQRRLEILAINQQQLLTTLIQVECMPRISFLI